MKKGNKNELFNFGKGWGTIIFCLLMFWFYAGMVNDSSNVVAPAVAEKLGIPAGNVLNMGTVAAMVGVIFFFVMGAVNRKIGPRVTSFICLILGGVGYFGMGHANSLAQYAIALCICTIGCMSAGYISGGAFVAQWFPKKKSGRCGRLIADCSSLIKCAQERSGGPAAPAESGSARQFRRPWPGAPLQTVPASSAK